LGWIGLDWVGLGWIGLDWVGLGWIGLDWVGLGWIGLDWVGLGWGVNGVEIGKGKLFEMSKSILQNGVKIFGVMICETMM
jgi:hypothetical protein